MITIAWVTVCVCAWYKKYFGWKKSMMMLCDEDSFLVRFGQLLLLVFQVDVVSGMGGGGGGG